ncbi:MAG: beta-galactosidase trimerization domain-containing protein, partial [Armatimonadota bacterium]|nr:beta-galactosidase trimerization domain-containing protein [Armatimonadota bacterium]
KECYGSVARLNAQWETQYASFDEAEPLHVDDLLDAGIHTRPFPEWNLSRWADHRSFMDVHFSAVLADLRAHANALDPATPAGFVGGQAPAAYGGFDYARLTRAVQWMEAYDIGATDEILRSFWAQRRPRVQTFFSSEKPHLDKWFLWYYLAHGDRGMIAWPDNNGRHWFPEGRPREEIRALAETFKEVQGPLGRVLTNARFLHDGIAVYYSHPSIQVSWFMDIQPHGRTWVNRSSSLNNENATDILNRWSWLKLLEDCGFQYEFVSYLDVRERGLDARRYRVLILPRALALSDEEARAIRRFAEAGGTVVADYLPGVFDEHGRGRQRGILDDLFGVRRDPGAGVLDGSSVAEVNAERYQEPLAQRLAYG